MAKKRTKNNNNFAIVAIIGIIVVAALAILLDATYYNRAGAAYTSSEAIVKEQFVNYAVDQLVSPGTQDLRSICDYDKNDCFKTSQRCISQAGSGCWYVCAASTWCGVCAAC